ncbi:MAG: hypothetical protein LBI90_03720 [Treponema sp.]|nr:hypothetical protein [Treponema sp.]
MKRILLLALVLGVFLSGLAFAADWTVQSVTGKVEREASPNTWEAVSSNGTLSDSAVVRIGLNSTLVLKSGDQVKTIRGAKTADTIEKLIVADNASGVKLGGKISASSTAVNARSTQSSSTASQRASEAVGDTEWLE